MSSTALTTTRTTRGTTIGRALIVIGGALVAISSWLNWGARIDLPERNLHAPARSAYIIPAKFVIDNGVGVPGAGLSLGIVVLVVGLLIVLAAFGPAWRFAGLVLGLAAAATAVLYVYQVRQVIQDANLGKSFRDFISIGVYLAAIGGALVVVGAVIALIPPGFWSSLTSEETSEEDDGKPAGASGAP
jgi:hypothetical protein